MTMPSVIETYIGSIKQVRITPENELWGEFINVSCNCICQYWPEVLDSTSRLDFSLDYEQSLKKRWSEGGRILLVWFLNGKLVGFANVWIEGTLVFRTLNIAEFHVLPPFQGQGLGKIFFRLLCDEGSRQGARNLRAEVDKHLKSNGFWSHLGLICDTTGERNVYNYKLLDLSQKS